MAVVSSPAVNMVDHSVHPCTGTLGMWLLSETLSLLHITLQWLCHTLDLISSSFTIEFEKKNVDFRVGIE